MYSFVNVFPSEGVAKGEDAMSILDNPRTRTLFIDDLMEVKNCVCCCKKTVNNTIQYKYMYIKLFRSSDSISVPFAIGSYPTIDMYSTHSFKSNTEPNWNKYVQLLPK